MFNWMLDTIFKTEIHDLEIYIFFEPVLRCFKNLQFLRFIVFKIIAEISWFAHTLQIKFLLQYKQR